MPLGAKTQMTIQFLTSIADERVCLVCYNWFWQGYLEKKDIGHLEAVHSEHCQCDHLAFLAWQSKQSGSTTLIAVFSCCFFVKPIRFSTDLLASKPRCGTSTCWSGPSTKVRAPAQNTPHSEPRAKVSHAYHQNRAGLATIGGFRRSPVGVITWAHVDTQAQ